MDGLGVARGMESWPQSTEQSERREMNLEQANEFVNSQKVLLTPQNMESRCVDGRYEGENIPMIAKPGGDIGDAMVLVAAANELGINLEPKEAIEIVVEQVGGVSHFQCHTDEHAEHDHAGHGMGCGHFKKSLLEPDAYGLKPEQTEAFIGVVNATVEQGGHEEILHGDHAEQAVFVVDSEQYGLNPLRRTGDGLQESFVYQKGVHQKQLAEMAVSLQETFAKKGLPVELGAVQKAVYDSFGKQLTATLQRLAVGLPVFTVAFDEVGRSIVSLT